MTQPCGVGSVLKLAYVAQAAFQIFDIDGNGSLDVVRYTLC